MPTPTARNLEDINSARLPILDPGPHTPGLGATLTGGYPVWLDLDDADGSPAFALTGDMGCGKTLALVTIARRFADTGGRAVLLNIKEQGIGDYLREAGREEDVTVLAPTLVDSLRFPLVRLFEPPQDATEDQAKQCASMLAQTIYDFVLRACQPAANRFPDDIADCIWSAAGEFTARAVPHENTTEDLLDVLGAHTEHRRLPHSGVRIVDHLRFLRDETAVGLVLDDTDGSPPPQQSNDPSACGVLVLDLSALRHLPAASVGPHGGELAGAADALRAVVLKWAWRLGTVLDSPRSGAQTKPPALVGIEQALHYSQGMSGDALEEILGTARADNVRVGLSAELLTDLRDHKDHLGHWFIGRTQLDDGHLREAFGWLGLDASEEVSECVGELPDGGFLYRDPRQRVRFIQVDPICRKRGQQTHE